MNFSKYSFVYNAAAHFAAMEKYPDTEDPDTEEKKGGLVNAVLQGGIAGFDALCWALEELSTQGELVRRNMGYDKQEPISAQTARVALKPYDVIAAKGLVMEAVAKGLRNDEDENNEVDEVLAELQKKTEKA